MKIWEDIKDYEDCYEVSTLERIRSKERQAPTRNPEILRTIKPQIKKLFPNRRGYETVVLSRKNKLKTFTVHQLVAQAFIPNFIKGTQINHIDGNPLNNKLSNLEESNSSHNQFNAVRENLLTPKGTSKYRNVSYISSPKAVKKWAACIRHDGKSSYGWKTFHTEIQAAKYIDELLDSIGDTDRLRNFS